MPALKSTELFCLGTDTDTVYTDRAEAEAVAEEAYQQANQHFPNMVHRKQLSAYLHVQTLDEAISDIRDDARDEGRRLEADYYQGPTY